MGKGNVLVVGNSGVGKSTLINAILGENVAVTSWGGQGTTKELEIYESEKLSFRVIDSKGFEPDSPFEFFFGNKAVKLVRKWSAESAKQGKEDKQINLIWFCIDGGQSKVFPKTIEDFCKATSFWKSVPVIAVITKSTESSKIQPNIQMVLNAFAKVNKNSKNLKRIIPVVAEPFQFNENAIVGASGLEDLILATNELMPEGIQTAKKDIADFTLGLKKLQARGITAVATASAVTVGAVPLPIPDAGLLIPIETFQINQIARIFRVSFDTKKNNLFNSMLEAGTVGVVAKTAIHGIKAIPGLGLSASVVNAIVAGVIVASLGEGATYIFEKVYSGEKKLDDIDFVKRVFESQSTTKAIQTLNAVLSKVTNETSLTDIQKLLVDLLKSAIVKK